MRANARYLLVWNGGRLPYPSRLTIESIVQTEPDAPVDVHLVDGDEALLDLVAVRRHPQVRVIRSSAEAVFEPFAASSALRALYGAIPARAASARSNLLRYALLHEHGGVYVDFDVLLLQPLSDLLDRAPFVGAERVWAGDRARVEGAPWLLRASTAMWAVSWAVRRLDCSLFAGRAQTGRLVDAGSHLWSVAQPNNAVIGTGAGSPFIRAVLDRALDSDPTTRYALGPSLLADVLAEQPHLATVLPPTAFYAVPPGESYRLFADRTLRLPVESRLVHYVSSNHRALLASLQPGDQRIAHGRGVFWDLLRSIEARMRAEGVSR